MLHTKQTSSQKRLHPRAAFTLVELIVVIAILVVLSTVGFVGYSGYTSTSRDASRGSDLKNIYQALKVSEANNGTVPEPDSAITIYSATGVTLSRQGVIGESVRKAINLESGGRDPKESTGYTYLRFKDKKSVQLLALFENEGWETRLAMKDIPGVGIPKAYAADYTDRFPVTSGKKLGILLESTTNTPLNEITSYTASGVNLGLSTMSTNSGILVIGNTESNIKETLSSTGVLARVISPSSLILTASEGGGSGGNGSSASTADISCKALKANGVSTDGLYWIKPTSDPAFQAYCDMTTDGGGWTLVVRALGDTNDHRDILAIGTLTSPTQITSAKLSDTMINSILKDEFRWNIDASPSTKTWFRWDIVFTSIDAISGIFAKTNIGDAWSAGSNNGVHISLQANIWSDPEFVYADGYRWYTGLGLTGTLWWGQSGTLWIK